MSKSRLKVIAYFSIALFFVSLMPTSLFHSQVQTTQGPIFNSSESNSDYSNAGNCIRLTKDGLGAEIFEANMSMKMNLQSLYNNALKYDLSVNESFVGAHYFLDMESIIENDSFHRYLLYEFPTWSLGFNYSSSQLTVYAMFCEFFNGSASRITFSSDTLNQLGQRISISTDSLGPTNQAERSVPAESALCCGSNNWAGYGFYDQESGSLKELFFLGDLQNVPNICSAPDPQGHNHESMASWIGLTQEPGGTNGIAQTGFSRSFTWYWAFGWFLDGGPTQIWYESYPSQAMVVYPGSPALQPGWNIDFNILNGLSPSGCGKGFEYSAYIENTSQYFAVQDNSMTFSTYYSNFIVEAQEIGSTVSQIAKFTPSAKLSCSTVGNGALPCLPGCDYKAGEYYQYVLCQYPNIINVYDNFCPYHIYGTNCFSGSGIVAMTWQSSESDV